MALCVTAFVFLSFSVFADTPVQPLQVVSYSDTTTNVRISGTAERLHYNIDSFQVVFMNPPNNYGTACTPVLISFRFYNASDLPAYVGQAEFELTATTSTGSVNTIIYGYDQISTDLFVAESSYSTAEVGRIGIGASNDFAYYTGFVIPPRTSLYFSCIVYVNASAYAQNNTGATEDVNQVTLSNLNLYTNQISFSADYPYHNQPIDFTDILQSISDLADTVSTSSEMQNLIDVLTYSGTNYSFTHSGRIYFNRNFSSSITGLDASISRIIQENYVDNVDQSYNSASDTSNNVAQYVYNVTYLITFYNNTGKTAYLNETLPITGFYPDNASCEIRSMITNTMSFTTLGGGSIALRGTHNRVVGARTVTCLPQGANHTVIECTFRTNTPITSWYDPNALFFNVTDTIEDYYLPQSEYYILRDLYLAYQSVNGLDDIDDTTDDIKDKSESAHTQEQSYFTQNAQAIQATGLSNYRFNGDQENGIGSVSHDFMLLWNSLGGFNSIYIFSLTLSLALMILRHAPNAIKSSRRNKEE